MNSLELFIESGGATSAPAVLDGVTWETERAGSPGKLTFRVAPGGSLGFYEGARVSFRADGKDIFYGFVFTKRRDKNQIITVTAYDQLRYLKNRDTYEYANRSASELIRMIARDFSLETGDITDTGHPLSRLEDNVTLFDMILNALDETAKVTGKGYVLFDDFGKLALKEVSGFKSNLLIQAETTEDFDYTSSIDGGTYNKVKLLYMNGGSGARDAFIEEDAAATDKWGTLQYFEKISETLGAAEKAKTLLSLYNRVHRSLSVRGVLGDPGVRAGMTVPVRLTLGDIDANTYLVVERAKHYFRHGSHTMDLDLGGDIFV